MTAALARRELGTHRASKSACWVSAARESATCIASSPTKTHCAAVRESFAAGVRYFDTAPFYGFGLSELRIGAALAVRNHRR